MLLVSLHERVFLLFVCEVELVGHSHQPDKALDLPRGIAGRDSSALHNRLDRRVKVGKLETELLEVGNQSFPSRLLQQAFKGSVASWNSDIDLPGLAGAHHRFNGLTVVRS